MESGLTEDQPVIPEREIHKPGSEPVPDARAEGPRMLTHGLRLALFQ